MITTIANTIQEYLSSNGYIVASYGSYGDDGDRQGHIVTSIRSHHHIWCCTIIYSDQGLTLVPLPGTGPDKVIEYAHPDLISTLILTINQYDQRQESIRTSPSG